MTITTDDQELSGNFRTFANIIKSFVGAGCLGLPYAFKKGGLGVGTVGYVFVAVLSLHCTMILLHIKRELEKQRSTKLLPSRPSSKMNDPLRQNLLGDDPAPEVQQNTTPGGGSNSDEETNTLPPVKTYTDVGNALFGKKGAWAVDIALLSSQMGFCSIYLVLWGKNLHSLHPDINQKLYSVMAIPICILLTWLPSLKWIASLSIVAIAIFLFMFGIVLAYSFRVPEFPDPSIEWASSVTDFPMFLALAIYGYEGIGLVLPIENSTRDKKSFPAVFMTGYIMVTLLYIGFGMVGYLGYGTHVQQIITDNLDSDLLILKIGRSLFLVAILITYPLFMWPVIERCESIPLLGIRRDSGSYWWKSRVFRAALVVTTAGFAVALPYFDIFTSFIGSLFSTTLSFTIPAICSLKFHWSTSSKLMKVKDISLIVWGILALIVCTASTANDLKNEIQSGSES